MGSYVNKCFIFNIIQETPSSIRNLTARTRSNARGQVEFFYPHCPINSPFLSPKLKLDVAAGVP